MELFWLPVLLSEAKPVYIGPLLLPDFSITFHLDFQNSHGRFGLETNWAKAKIRLVWRLFSVQIPRFYEGELSGKKRLSETISTTAAVSVRLCLPSAKSKKEPRSWRGWSGQEWHSRREKVSPVAVSYMRIQIAIQNWSIISIGSHSLPQSRFFHPLRDTFDSTSADWYS